MINPRGETLGAIEDLMLDAQIGADEGRFDIVFAGPAGPHDLSADDLARLSREIAFLLDNLELFAGLARDRNDQELAGLCNAEAARLRRNIEEQAWDGGWYKRAWFGDGTPLGSSSNDECQIDSISQSWAILSGGGDPLRARQAMTAVDQRLVRRDKQIVQLLDPPFDKLNLEPGYIKGYIPGVRENGGQYTHAAIWPTMAFAMMGDTERAWELFAMLNPVNHGSTPESIEHYKVEPYVMCADIYGVSPHIGRGGVDLVYRGGGLDVSPDRGNPAGAAIGRGPSASGTLCTG